MIWVVAKNKDEYYKFLFGMHDSNRSDFSVVEKAFTYVDEKMGIQGLVSNAVILLAPSYKQHPAWSRIKGQLVNTVKTNIYKKVKLSEVI